MLIAALDQTILATAIPTIAAKLHSAAGYTWIGGAYLLANAAGACIWAKLSDIWGRKLILLIAVAWFFISSIVCAVAVNMEMLIAGRALQVSKSFTENGGLEENLLNYGYRVSLGVVYYNSSQSSSLIFSVSGMSFLW